MSVVDRRLVPAERPNSPHSDWIGVVRLQRPDLGSVRPVTARIAAARALIFWRGWSMLRTLGVCATLGVLAGTAGLPPPDPLEPEMLSWSTIAYGASLSAVAAAVLAYAGSRRAIVSLLALLAAATAPTAWNAVLRATHAREFFTDAPIAAMPASWQDAGSGVLTFALAVALLGLGPLAARGRRAVGVAALAGLAAFLVDVYLY